MGKGSFTHTVNFHVSYMSGTFNLFNVMCKQHHGSALNPFLNGTKNGDIYNTCKGILKANKYLQHQTIEITHHIISSNYRQT